ncbi:MAG: response regulator [Opitutus sp.]|nr:response regulator [Opitutus sp.]MCS6273231.1 response regulator [Opitutus sp.]MCS6277992.1 response regulator [Opitutus sp.]MCS6298900.1 response regulator [Opitutus sp.]
MNSPEPVVLIADDCETDVMLMRSVFRGAGFTQPLQFAHDGEEAMAYLRGDGAYRNRDQFPLPCVLLLDLNRLRKNGFDVLAWQQGQPELKRLPVYILSASSRPEDIERAYDLGAHAYLVKPCSLDSLALVAKQLFAWIKINHYAA